MTTIPRRDDDFATWLKARRDDFGRNTGQWSAIDDLLDDYRLHADTGTPLDRHACETGNPDDCAGCYDEQQAAKATLGHVCEIPHPTVEDEEACEQRRIAAQAKPPVPANKFLPWPRIDVDTSEGSHAARLLIYAGRTGYEAGLDPSALVAEFTSGTTLTPARVAKAGAKVALLHLLELGLIDPDTARIDAAEGIPLGRKDARS